MTTKELRDRFPGFTAERPPDVQYLNQLHPSDRDFIQVQTLLALLEIRDQLTISAANTPEQQIKRLLQTPLLVPYSDKDYK